MIRKTDGFLSVCFFCVQAYVPYEIYIEIQSRLKPASYVFAIRMIFIDF